MSGETEKEISGWTVDTLHSHIKRLMEEADLRYQQRAEAQAQGVKDALAAAEKAVAAAMNAASLAVTKAELAAEKRFDSVNEFRGQLKDQAATLLPREEYVARHTALEQRVGRVEAMQTRIGGRDEGKSANAAMLLAIGALLVGVIGIFVALFRH